MFVIHFPLRMSALGYIAQGFVFFVITFRFFYVGKFSVFVVFDESITAYCFVLSGLGVDEISSVQNWQ